MCSLAMAAGSIAHGRSLSETSSRCVMGSATATHNFTVTNFLLLDGMGIGKFVSSSTFSVAGRDWRIDLYPDGSERGNQYYVSTFLYFVRGTLGTSVTMNFTLLVGDSERVRKTCVTTFESVNAQWGYSRLTEKSSLLESLRLDGGSLTIRCVVTVKHMPRTEDVCAVVVPQPKLHQDLKDMLKNGEGADVTFSVGGQLFPAHRCILAARSAVFRAELFGAMREKDAQRRSKTWSLQCSRRSCTSSTRIPCQMMTAMAMRQRTGTCWRCSTCWLRPIGTGSTG